MFYSWLPMLLIVAGSLVTGRAITRACGQGEVVGNRTGGRLRGPDGGRGPAGPGSGNAGAALIAGLVVLAAASLWILRRPRREDLPGSPFFWVAGLIAALLLTIPFAVTGHWGLLGMGYNNDLGLHRPGPNGCAPGSGPSPATATRWGRTGSRPRSTIPDFALGRVFIGQVAAIAVLTVMTAGSGRAARPLAPAARGDPWSACPI